MKRKCIFKVTAGKEGYKVVIINGILSAVMRGRDYAPKPFLYGTPDEAINRAIYLAKLELHKNDLLLYEP